MNRRIKVLVVHEEEDGRTLICNLLAAGGCWPIPVGSARDAMELARIELPDVIVMELPLPDFASRQVLQDLHRDLRLRRVPLIWVSSVDTRRVFPRAVRGGPAAEGSRSSLVVLEKPRAAAELLGRVKALGARRQKRTARPRPPKGR